jgi:hypothetical protein
LLTPVSVDSFELKASNSVFSSNFILNLNEMDTNNYLKIKDVDKVNKYQQQKQKQKS